MDPSKHAPLRINDIRSKYKVIDKVGKGTYGTVFKVLNLEDKKYYAIKKFQNTEAKLQVQGFPITALREISLLKQLNHPNIVNLQEIICSKPNKRNLYRGSTFMVFQYMHHDFSGLFRSKIKFSLAEIKCIMKQILLGCSFLHQNKVMHRDIKSANILLNDQGIVQLADFGLGRRTRFDNVYTYKVVTLWYRAPQLLLGCKTYNHKIDVWSIGCVLAELLTGEVLFKKQTEYAIIEKIYQVCGDLDVNEYTEDYLRGCVYYNDMRPKKAYKNTLESYIKKFSPNVDPITLHFLQGLLQLNPYKRLSCEEALEHEFFKVEPKACQPQEIQKLDVQYHEMFRDRSLKIQRKTRKESVDWSEEDRKKSKVERVEIQENKEVKYQERQNKPYVRPQKEKVYVQKPYERRNYDNRYNERRDNYLHRQYSKHHEDYRQRKKYSRSPSHSKSSSSSSSSRSRRSRSRNGKRYYDEERKGTYAKRDAYDHREKGEIYVGEKDNRPQRGRDKPYGDRNRGSQYNYAKGYQQRGQNYKKQYHHEQSRFYRQKSYDNRQRKDYARHQHEEKRQGNYRPLKEYPRENFERSYSRTAMKEKQLDDERIYRNDKYEQRDYREKGETYREKGDDYRTKNVDYKGYRDYEHGQYKGRRETNQKHDNDRYSRGYQKQSRGDSARKQYYSPSQKYHESKSYSKPNDREYKEDRQYRGYPRHSYDYPRKQTRHRDDLRYNEYSHHKESYKIKEDSSKYREQSRNKDYISKKISIQSRESTEQKKSSPQKKDIDIEDY